MNRAIAAAAMTAALLLTPHVMAAETPDDAIKAQGSVEPTGAPAALKPGTETSDRTPEKATPTPDTQVGKTAEGETSDRTPEHHGEIKQ